MPDLAPHPVPAAARRCLAYVSLQQACIDFVRQSRGAPSVSCSAHSFITYSLWSGEQSSGAIVDMDVRARVGRNLQRLRRDRELTQEELAHKAEIHQTYLSGVEVGKRNPSILVLDRIVKALGVDISQLFER